MPVVPLPSVTHVHHQAGLYAQLEAEEAAARADAEVLAASVEADAAEGRAIAAETTSRDDKAMRGEMEAQVKVAHAAQRKAEAAAVCRLGSNWQPCGCACSP